jgi:hypothetical protein
LLNGERSVTVARGTGELSDLSAGRGPTPQESIDAASTTNDVIDLSGKVMSEKCPYEAERRAR